MLGGMEGSVDAAPAWMLGPSMNMALGEAYGETEKLLVGDPDSVMELEPVVSALGLAIGEIVCDC